MTFNMKRCNFYVFQNNLGDFFHKEKTLSVNFYDSLLKNPLFPVLFTWDLGVV